MFSCTLQMSRICDKSNTIVTSLSLRMTGPQPFFSVDPESKPAPSVGNSLTLDLLERLNIHHERVSKKTTVFVGLDHTISVATNVLSHDSGFSLRISKAPIYPHLFPGLTSTVPPTLNTVS